MSFVYREPLVREGDWVEVSFLRHQTPFNASRYFGRVEYMSHQVIRGEHFWFCHVSNKYFIGGELELTIRDTELQKFNLEESKKRYARHYQRD